MTDPSFNISKILTTKSKSRFLSELPAWPVFCVSGDSSVLLDCSRPCMSFQNSWTDSQWNNMWSKLSNHIIHIRVKPQSQQLVSLMNLSEDVEVQLFQQEGEGLKCLSSVLSSPHHRSYLLLTGSSCLSHPNLATTTVTVTYVRNVARGRWAGPESVGRNHFLVPVDTRTVLWRDTMWVKAPSWMYLTSLIKFASLWAEAEQRTVLVRK